MASRREVLQQKLGSIEKRISALEGGAPKADEGVHFLHEKASVIHGSAEFDEVKGHVAYNFGNNYEEKNATNEKIDALCDEVGDVNFYSCATLLILDDSEGSDFNGCRSNMKLFLLPCFQLLVPFGMCWYFIVKKKLIEENGYCTAHGSYIFRGTGFVTFMYSAWQMIDGDGDPSAKFFLRMSVRHYALTGSLKSRQAAIMFYLGNLTQQLCALFLLFTTFIIYTSQCDTPLDLVMNCVAINFVLDIDSEWMDEKKQGKAIESAKSIFKGWRDVCVDFECDVRTHVKGNHAWRRSLPKILDNALFFLSTFIWVGAYCLVFGWTFCPPEL